MVLGSTCSPGSVIKWDLTTKGKRLLALGKFKSDGVVGIFNGNASKGFFFKERMVLMMDYKW